MFNLQLRSCFRFRLAFVFRSDYPVFRFRFRLSEKDPVERRKVGRNREAPAGSDLPRLEIGPGGFFRQTLKRKFSIFVLVNSQTNAPHVFPKFVSKDLLIKIY